MGRIVELCGEVAAEAEEGPEGLVLPPEAWERLRAEWQDQDIEDALALVQDSLMQSELVESADSLSATCCQPSNLSFSSASRRLSR